jgi:hypothetical protein
MTRERLQAVKERACYHTVLKRLYDERHCCWTGTWVCECGFVFDRVDEIFKGRMGSDPDKQVHSN